MCMCLCFLRLCLLIYLFHVGTTFLITEQGYVDLLLNSVALAFILDLPSLLYIVLLSDSTKGVLDGAHTKEYETCLPARGIGHWLLSKAVWGLLVLPLLAYWVVFFNQDVNTGPLLEALRCACLQQGPNCEMATRSSRPLWDTYWNHIQGMFATNKGSLVSPQ